MKRISATWSRLSASDRRSLVILMVFLAITAGYLLVVEPVYHQYTAVFSQINELEQTRQKHSGSARSLVHREAKLAEVRTEYQYLLDKLDVENTGAHTLVEMINEIENFAAKTGVRIDQIRPMPIIDQGIYHEMSLEIMLHASFDLFQRFIYYLETSPQVFIISNASLNREENGISARLTISKMSLENAAQETALSSDRTDLRIGLEFWPGYALFYIAEHKGWLQNDGLSIKLVHGTDGSQMVRLLETGELDGACLSLGSLIENLEKGLDLRAVYPLAWTQGAEAVVVADGSAIQQVADLRGKTVHAGSRLSQYLLFRALQRNGLELHDVTLGDLNTRMISQSLTTGMIEAGVVWDPYLSQLTREKTARVIFSSAQIPGEIMENLVLHAGRMTRDHRPVILFLIRALVKAGDWLAENPEEAVRIVAQRLKMDPESVRAGLGVIHFPTTDEVRQIIDPAEKENGMERFIRHQEEFLGAFYGKTVHIPRDLLVDWSVAAEQLKKNVDDLEQEQP